jgi:hypothetical protein
MADPVRRGRPPIGTETKRGAFTSRLRADVKAALEAEAAGAGRSLSEEIEVMCEWRVAAPNRAPLLHLFEHIARVVDPYNRWQETSPNGAAARRALIRGLGRALERLAHPDDPGMYNPAPDPEGTVDTLLSDAGRETAGRDPLEYVWRWAAETRRHLGPLGPLLMEMHQTSATRRGNPSPAVYHPADNLNLLQAALEQARALLASTRSEAAAIEAQGGEPARNKLRRLQEVEETLTQLMLAGESPSDD